MGEKKYGLFGQFLEMLRQRKRLTLREFCRRAKCDPANISRLERGVIPPPKAREILERYAEVLELKEGTDDWYKFFDLAAAEQGVMPADIMDNKKLVKSLPLFFRTLRGQKPSVQEMRKIVKKIKTCSR